MYEKNYMFVYFDHTNIGTESNKWYEHIKQLKKYEIIIVQITGTWKYRDYSEFHPCLVSMLQ